MCSFAAKELDTRTLGRDRTRVSETRDALGTAEDRETGQQGRRGRYTATGHPTAGRSTLTGNWLPFGHESNELGRVTGPGGETDRDVTKEPPGSSRINPRGGNTWGAKS